MEHVYQWAASNPFFASVIGIAGSFLLLAIPNDWIKKIAFNLSQIIRKSFGSKLEQAIEDKVNAFDEGMKSDGK